MPDGKQRRESVGALEGLSPYAVTDARQALAKRTVQRKERRIFDMLPESEMTFDELTKWYLDLAKVRALASYDIIKIKLNIFNSEFGKMIVSDIKPVNLENYQAMRTKQGAASVTVDQEIRKVKVMIYEMLFSLPNRIQETSNDNHVFQFYGKPVSDIRAGLKNVCKKAGIKYGRFVKDGFIFHDLRHTFNTNMRKAGIAESVIMEVTGHSIREMFDRYNTIDEEDTRKAVDQLATFLKNVDHPVDHEGQNDKAVRSKSL